MRCLGDAGAHKNTEHESGYFEEDEDDMRRDDVVNDDDDSENNNNDLGYGLCGDAPGEDLFYGDGQTPNKGMSSSSDYNMQSSLEIPLVLQT